MAPNVYVTGLGVVSGMGNNVAETLTAFKERRSGVAALSIIKSKLNGVVPASEVKLPESGLRELSGVTAGGVWSRTDYLGVIAVAEAIKQAGIDPKDDIRTGLISATSVGGMDKYELFYEDFMKEQKTIDWGNFILHDCGNSTERIAEHFGITGFIMEYINFFKIN